MTDTRIPSTAFADAWIQVDRTEDPGFFVRLLDSTRAQLLERARKYRPSSSRRWTFAPGIAFSMSDAEPAISCGYLLPRGPRKRSRN